MMMERALTRLTGMELRRFLRVSERGKEVRTKQASRAPTPHVFCKLILTKEIDEGEVESGESGGLTRVRLPSSGRVTLDWQSKVNYRRRLAVVGDTSWQLAESAVLRVLVKESNRGEHV